MSIIVHYIQTEIEKQSTIMLMCTDATLPIFAFGFIEEVFKLYYYTPAQQRTYKDWVDYYQHQILKNPEWVQKTKEKAREWGKSFEEVVQIDAEYMARERK